MVKFIFKIKSVLKPVRLFETLWDGALPGSPWDFPGKNTAMGCHFPPPEDLQPRDQKTYISYIADIFLMAEPPRKSELSLNEH